MLPLKQGTKYTEGERMLYITAEEAARRWGVTTRLVQRYCKQGRIAGAEKLGGSWRIPEGTVKPDDPRRGDRTSMPQVPSRRPTSSFQHLMPLMGTAYAPGTAKAFVASLANGTRASVAQAELAYFSGDAERARDLAAPLLRSDDAEARLSACLISAFSNLTLGRINDARFALDGALGSLNSEMGGGTPPEVTAMAAFIGNAASALLHLPAPKSVQAAPDLLPLLPPGLRLFACYVKAHRLYLEGAYEQSYGIVLGAFAMADALYPIPAIYLHLAAVMSLMALRRTDEARQHVLAAWDIARPDGLIQPFGEQHGLLGGMLEAAIKPAWPDDFKRMIDITYRFSAGWRRVHNPSTADDVADNLTTTEFAVCMLASRDWSNAEIAEHMGFSVNRVKECLSNAFRKLGVSSRKDLARFMLA